MASRTQFGSGAPAIMGRRYGSFSGRQAPVSSGGVYWPGCYWAKGFWATSYWPAGGGAAPAVSATRPIFFEEIQSTFSGFEEVQLSVSGFEEIQPATSGFEEIQ